MSRRRSSRPPLDHRPDLPFAAPLAHPDAEGARWNFWAVTPSGNYAQDCLMGAFYGTRAVQEMRRLGTGWLLQDIVWAMVRQADRRHKGLVLGFCSAVERALLAGRPGGVDPAPPDVPRPE
jgi:hypothetical protein